MAIHENNVIHRARFYDLGTSLMGGRVRAMHRRMIERAAIRPGDSVLDVGCGPGRLTVAAALAAGPGETLGIDPSPEMIALARSKAARARSTATFRVGVIEAIPVPDDHFDVVLASLMLHHVPAELQRRGFAEVFRVLAPGGRFVALDFTAMPGHGLGHLLTALGLRRGSAHVEHLRALAQEAGFAPVEVTPASRAFSLLYAAVSMHDATPAR